ncbi:hypothetical protein [Polynucleobacter sp.]|uniref:hypothetical protein n=1 Tax=Polynucleobacter sp. TaxID=2029855 RepID=UPI003F69D6CA
MTLAYAGDEVFFHHKGEPKVGKVLAVGRHGCTVEHEKTRHKLKWEHIAGHSSRAKQDYTVEHHGEDGMIVKSQNGQKRFISIPAEAKAEQYELQEKKPIIPARSKQASQG